MRLAHILLTILLLGCGSSSEPEISGDFSGELSGVVTSAESGLPIADLHVLIKGADLFDRTDSKGEFLFFTPIGSFERAIVLVAGRGFESSEFRVRRSDHHVSGSLFHTDVALKPGESDLPILSGHVSDSESGQGLGGVEIRYRGRTYYSESDGSYEVPFLDYDRALISVDFTQAGYRLERISETEILQTGPYDLQLDVGMVLQE